MTLHCQNCQTELPDGAKFCFNCGQPTAAATPSPASIDQQEQAVDGPQTNVERAEGPVLSGTFHGPVAETITLDPDDPDALRRAYLERLMRDCERLPLRGVDVGAADPGRARQRRLSLAQVYVELDTKTQALESFLEALAAGDTLPDLDEVRHLGAAGPGREEKRQPLSALNAAIAGRRLVLLGDPGSGKSTFLNHLTLCLAGAARQPDGDWSARLPCWPERDRDLIPLPVVLRDFARWLERHPPEAGTRPAPAKLLWDFVERWLADAGLAPFGRHLLDALLKGRAVVLLDGLDEIPGAAQRRRVRDAVADFGKTFRDCRLLVTCRTLSYTDPAWQLPPAEFLTFELAPLDEAKIGHFIDAWYAELADLGVVPAREAAALAGRLKSAVRRPDLWRLAPNPLLLTVMALVHTHKGRLPEARALLYEDCVDLLLWRWEERKGAQAGLRRLLLDAGLQDVDLKRALWRIAFQAHQSPAVDDNAAADATADVPQADLLKGLRALHPDGSWDWAQALVDQMKERAGLLVERQPEVYAFPHRTFQEYLAGCHLSAQGEFASRAAALAAQGPLWREVILLAVGRLVHLAGDTDKPLALAAELCPGETPTANAGWRAAALAGQVLLETGLARVRGRGWGQKLLGRTRRHLAALLERGALPPLERAEAGRALAAVGDPRPGVGLDPETGLPDTAWCEVPAGPFKMGTPREDVPALKEQFGEFEYYRYEWETPQHEVRLPAFYIAKYPITNIQYLSFVSAGGYAEPHYWHEAQAVGLWQPGRLTCYTWSREKQELVETHVDGPQDYGPPFNLPNHPVVGVSWYEAVAFCRWLTEAWRAEGKIGPDELVRLPSEAEWEKAARGPSTSSGCGQVYPWGDAFDAGRCNMNDTGIGATSAVGIFPSGASPYGVLDLSGNVWEWCATRWQEKYPLPQEAEWDSSCLGGTTPRVLRGGAFYNNQGCVRCAARDRLNPHDRSNYGGLRVGVFPV